MTFSEHRLIPTNEIKGNLADIVGRNVRVMMAERSIKAINLANDTGIARSTMTTITNGRGKQISFQTIEKIAAYLGVFPYELFIEAK